MNPKVMLSADQVRNWVEQGGGWCPFCQAENVRYVSTVRAINGLTTVEYFCASCRNGHFAVYQGDQLIDLTHDKVAFIND